MRWRASGKMGSIYFISPVAYGIVHGCGYIHLSNSTPGTRKKCCVNGRLSSASDNFEEELMMGYVLDDLPAFVRKVISSSTTFSQKSSTYSNLVAMAATVVCNYNETAQLRD